MNGDMWEVDPLPVPEPPRPEDGSDVDWWRCKSHKTLIEEDAIERSRRLRMPVVEVEA